MLKLLGCLCVAAGGALAWYLQLAERRRKRDTLSDLQTAFRRMGEEVRVARTPMPKLLDELAADCGPEGAAFFTAVSETAARGECLSETWCRAAETLPLNEGVRAAVSELGKDLQGDEEKVCKALSHVTYLLAQAAGEMERKRHEEERRAAALWFSASALLVILLI